MDKYEFIAKKYADGASIMETIRSCMKEYKLSLVEANAMVSMHPVWSSVVEAAEPLRRDLGSDLNK